MPILSSKVEKKTMWEALFKETMIENFPKLTKNEETQMWNNIDVSKGK